MNSGLGFSPLCQYVAILAHSLRYSSRLRLHWSRRYKSPNNKHSPDRSGEPRRYLSRHYYLPAAVPAPLAYRRVAAVAGSTFLAGVEMGERSAGEILLAADHIDSPLVYKQPMAM